MRYEAGRRRPQIPHDSVALSDSALEGVEDVLGWSLVHGPELGEGARVGADDDASREVY
jgi:hypothetical protein